MSIANTIVSSKDKDVFVKHQLKYSKSIRITISDSDDTIVRMCDACCIKRECETAFPLVEIPLVHIDETSLQCFGGYVFDQCIVMCPACALLVDRCDVRFTNRDSDGWSCVFCNPHVEV